MIGTLALARRALRRAGNAGILQAQRPKAASWMDDMDLMDVMDVRLSASIKSIRVHAVHFR